MEITRRQLHEIFTLAHGVVEPILAEIDDFNIYTTKYDANVECYDVSGKMVVKPFKVVMPSVIFEDLYNKLFRPNAWLMYWDALGMPGFRGYREKITCSKIILRYHNSSQGSVYLEIKNTEGKIGAKLGFSIDRFRVIEKIEDLSFILNKRYDLINVNGNQIFTSPDGTMMSSTCWYQLLTGRTIFLHRSPKEAHETYLARLFESSKQ